MVLWVVTGGDAYDGREYGPLAEGSGEGWDRQVPTGGSVVWGEKFLWRGVSLYQCGRCMKLGDIFADKKLKGKGNNAV